MTDQNTKDPFADPETAVDEIAQRIGTLRKQASHDLNAAAEHDAAAERLRERATYRKRIAYEYEKLARA